MIAIHRPIASSQRTRSRQQSEPLPAESGTYVLVVRCHAALTVEVGQLCRMPLVRGWYLYVGSAFGPGGLAARRHWHIDYLLPLLPIREIWHSSGRRDLEHCWARTILEQSEAKVPVEGFGASDCKCRSHLAYFPTYRQVNKIHIGLSPTPDRPK